MSTSVANEPFQIPTENMSRPEIFSPGTVPLSQNEVKDLGGAPLGERGLAAEIAAIIERDRLAAELEAEKPVKRKRGRPRKNPPRELSGEIQKGSLNKATAEQDEDGSIKKITVTMDFDFVREIVVAQSKMFKLIEYLSSGNPRLSSPTNGGLDFEYMYALQKRLRDAGLL